MQEIEEEGALVSLIDVHNVLGDVLGSGTDTAHGKVDVVVQEIASKKLDLLGEGSTEHESLSLARRGHVLALDNGTDLVFETHVQHAIGLIKDEEAAVSKVNATTLKHIHQSAGGGNKQVATLLEIAHLRANVGTTVHDARTDTGSVSELASLVVDLKSQLTSGGKHESLRVLLGATARTAGGRTRRLRLEDVRKGGDEESGSLAGSGLSASHQITLTHDSGDRVLLNGSGLAVASKLDVLPENGSEINLSERGDRLRGIVAGSFDRDVVVLVEVDTGSGGTKEFLFYASISGCVSVPIAGLFRLVPASLTGSRGIAAPSTRAVIAATVATTTTITTTASVVVAAEAATTTTVTATATAVTTILTGRRRTLLSVSLITR
eukprot:Colp12_sorted_trinity150504_noHs@31596